MPAVIFDMDGILIDSEPLWRRSMIKVFAEYGLNLTEEQCRSTKGMKIDDVIVRWKQKGALKTGDIEKIKNAIHEDLLIRIQHEGIAVSGACELVRWIKKKKGWKTGLATSSSSELMYAVMEKLKLKNEMDAMVCAEPPLRAKPHPDVYLECSRLLGLSPEECWAIEDSWFGITSARNAGMNVVGIPETPEEIIQFQNTASFVLESVSILYNMAGEGKIFDNK